MSAATAIRNDHAFAQMTDAILRRDQPRTTDIFYGMVAREGRSVGDALSVAMAAEAPFVQVPNHINVKDGQIILINNDHTILGLRTSADLASYLPKEYQLLPMLQSVWYIPAGLDIWNQLLGKYPGRYATMKGMNVPPPDYGPVVWNEQVAPIVEAGTLEERLYQHLIATMGGDVKRSYGLFLGLAAEPAARHALKDQLLFLGLIDVQDKVAGRKARNTGHKALRARAITDLADFIGWEKSDGVYYTGVPDMAIGPLYYAMYDSACVLISAEFPDAGKSLKQANKGTLSNAEVEELLGMLMVADIDTLWGKITAHLKAGISVRSLGDAMQLGAAEIILRTTVPRNFTNGQHPFDYCNTANHWFRKYDNPYQPRILYLMAHFINDVARSDKLTESVIERDCAGYDFSGKTGVALLAEQDEAILAFDIARTTAISAAYLKSGADRSAYCGNVALTACKFQDDPHNQKISHSSFQEYEMNSTHLKDRLLLVAPRLLAGWPKMPGERDCYARFMKDWIKH